MDPPHMRDPGTGLGRRHPTAREPGPGGRAARGAHATYALAVVAGMGLFFVVFATIFVGSWAMLALALGGYPVAGVLGVRFGRVAPRAMAIALVLPAVPWTLWLFPASIGEAGLARALLWPALALFSLALAWAGGAAAASPRERAAS